MKSITRYKNLFLAAISVLIIAAILFFLTQNEYGKMNDLERNQREKEANLIIQQKKLTSLEAMSRTPDEINLISSFVHKQLPDGVESTIFVSELEKLGQATQVTPLSVSVNSTPISNKNKTGATAYPFTMTFSTNFVNLLAVLDQMEKLDRYNSITNLTLSPSESSLNISLSGNIYEYKQTKK